MSGFFNKAMRSALLAAAIACGAVPSVADDWETLGLGRLFTNDFLGDGRDRWQSGSYVLSGLRGAQPWDGAPQPFGRVLEYRLRTAIISSDGLGDAPDRLYVGTMSFGVHSHFGSGSTQARLGGDVTIVGPQTRLADFQARVHDRFDLVPVGFTDAQVDDDILFGISAEAAEVLTVAPQVTVRPFGEVQAGPEDLIRVGTDVFFGDPLTDDILIRDVTTGHLYHRAEERVVPGITYVAGLDVATVTDSAFLPDSGPGALRDTRLRGRVGVHWRQAGGSDVFYGLTYLSPEFDGQGEGQVVGSLTLNLHF